MQMLSRAKLVRLNVLVPWTQMPRRRPLEPDNSAGSVKSTVCAARSAVIFKVSICVALVQSALAPSKVPYTVMSVSPWFHTNSRSNCIVIVVAPAAWMIGDCKHVL